MGAALNRYAHIDFMRAVAVLLVVLQHAGLENGLLGSAGVTMFFVVSGFVITNLVLREEVETSGFHLGTFYVRRALKILPPLGLVILLPSMIAGLFSGWQAVKPLALASQLLFFYNTVRIEGQSGVLPGADVVWSLSVEEQFYIGFAVIWLLCLQLRRPRVALAWVAGTAFIWASIMRLVMAYLGSQRLAQQLYFSTPTRIDAIALGVLLALLVSSGYWQIMRLRASPLVWDALFFAAVTLLCATLLMQNYEANYSWMISLHALVAGAVIVAGFARGGLLLGGLAKAAQWRWLNRIGLASYSIYLVHHMVSLGLAPMVAELPLPAQWIIKSLAGLAAGFLLWWAIELPLERFKQRKFSQEWRGPVTVR